MELLLSLILSGRLLHNLGAATPNIRSPKLDVLDVGILRRPLLHDRSLWAGEYGTISSFMCCASIILCCVQQEPLWLLCSDNTVLCLEKCSLCLQIWATASFDSLSTFLILNHDFFKKDK